MDKELIKTLMSATAGVVKDHIASVLAPLTGRVDELQRRLDSIRIPESIKGDKGDPGESVKGDAGEKGDRGEIGPQGERGEKGETGPIGPKGDTGERGIAGERGLDGTKGDRGEKGEIGPVGPIGERGESGIPGERGENGTKGEKGDTGIQGPQGERGERGVSGDKGDKGDRGEPGIIGKAGDVGPRGEHGEKGLDGKDGRDGRDGKDGKDGSDGLNGRDALQLDILPGINPQKSVPRGTFALHDGGILMARRQTTPAETIDWDEWAVAVRGVSRLEWKQDETDERRFTIKSILTGEESSEQQFRIPVLVHKGRFLEGTVYEKGDVVRWNRSSFVCQADKTMGVPEVSKDWQILAQRGDRGNDGKDLEPPKPMNPIRFGSNGGSK